MVAQPLSVGQPFPTRKSRSLGPSVGSQRKKMKKLLWLIPLIMCVVGITSLAYTSQVSASKTLQPSAQMFSARYSSTSLPPNVYTVVETINFSVSSSSKLEVVADNLVLLAGSFISTESSFQINLDSSTLYTAFADEGGHNTVDGTVTDGSVTTGKHTLKIACNPANFDPTQATATASGSVSAIITTGL
jgi:hypothetical protein